MKWFSYEKPSLFMTQETHRSRRNLIAVSSIAVLICHDVLSINPDASFFGIAVHLEPKSSISIEHVFICMIVYEIAMFLTRFWTDYGAWADVKTVTGGTFDHAAESISARQSVKQAILHANNLLEEIQSHGSPSNPQQTINPYKDALERLIDELQKYNYPSFLRMLFETIFLIFFMYSFQ